MNNSGQSLHTLEELRAERIAALNLMEDAVAARRETERANAALRESEAQLAADLAQTKQLQALSSVLVEQDDPEALYARLIEAAMTLMRSDAASLQKLDEETGGLRMIAWKGLHPDSAKFWERVSAVAQCNCGVALRTGQRQIVTDVNAAPSLRSSPDFHHFRLSSIVAVQTTPLISRAGHVVGMLSTHWNRPHHLGERDLALIDVLARQAADVLERTVARIALRKSEERYRAIVNQNLAGIIQMDQNGNVLVDNEQFCRRLGTACEELLQLNVRDFVHPEDLPETIRLLKKMARDGKPFEIEKRLVRRDGTHFWVHNAITPLTNAGENIQVATIVSLDVSARREAEAALRANEEQFRSAIEYAPIPVIMHAEDGQVLQISRTWTDLTGYKQKDIPTFDAWLNKAYGPGADRVRHLARKLFNGQAHLSNAEIEVTTQKGERRRWSFSASAPGRLRDGRRYIVGMALDVTERAEELREANKALRALSKQLVEAQETERRKIAETLHDDIGQVLTALNLMLKRARRRSSAIEITEAELLVADLLERVRRLALNLRPHVLDNLGLAAALRWHVKTFSEQTKIKVSLRLQRVRRDLPSDVATTAFRAVQEALTNVARHADARNTRIEVNQATSTLKIEIHDNGRGFDSKKLSAGASGLVNLRERVRLSGGEFGIESAARHGTRIRIILPLPETSTGKNELALASGAHLAQG